MKNANTYSYYRLALLFGAVGLAVVACSDDEGSTGGTAGSGGSSAGTSSSGSSSGGSSAGKPNGGSANGGNGGTSTAGNNNGGKAGSSTAGTSAGGQPAGGEAGAGGQGNAGEAMGGAIGVPEGGAAGAGGTPEPVWGTLQNATFEYEDGTTGYWKEEGDTDASTFKWIADQQPGLNHYAATAYKVSTFQTVSPLANGTYSFSLQIDRAANLNEQYLFARGCKAGDPTGMQKQPTDAAGTSGLTKITLSNIEVTAGSCTVGIYTDSPDGGWSNIDNAVFMLQP